MLRALIGNVCIAGILMWSSGCNSATSPSDTVRQYYSCAKTKDSDCQLKLLTGEWVKNIGDGSLSQAKEHLDADHRFMTEELISIDNETSAAEIAEVRATHKSMENNRIWKQSFHLKKINGVWLINDIGILGFTDTR